MIIALLRPLVLPALSEWYGRCEAETLFRDAVDRAAQGVPHGEHASATGGRLMVRLATLTHALHTELVASGLDREEATRRTARVTWVVYGRAGRWVGAAAMIRGRADPVRALKAATRIFRRFPFGPPDYLMVDLASPDGVAAFDVQRCPVALYFRGVDEVELCKASFYDLDFKLAPLWGTRLQRSQTLVEGHECCDFRWHATDANA